MDAGQLFGGTIVPAGLGACHHRQRTPDRRQGGASGWPFARRRGGLASRAAAASCDRQPEPVRSGWAAAAGPAGGRRGDRAWAIELLRDGQVEAGLECFVDSVSQPGAWSRSSATFRQMVRDNAQTLVPQIGDALPAYDREQAAALAVPVLLVSGELSPAQYRDNATALAAWLPDARHHVLAGASHGMTFTHARRCNALLAEFVTSVAVG